MTWAEIIDLVWKGLVVLGGGGVVIGGIAAFVGKFVADRTIESRRAELTKQVEEKKAELSMEVERLKGELTKETETHKLRLKKAEILFNKEFDAATEFIALHRKIRPQYRHEDMDWSEACIETVERFAMVEDWLESYVAKHGAALSSDVRKMIDECISIASSNKFAPRQGGEALRQAEEAADKFLVSLPNIEAQFAKELRS